MRYFRAVLEALRSRWRGGEPASAGRGGRRGSKLMFNP